MFSFNIILTRSDNICMFHHINLSGGFICLGPEVAYIYLFIDILAWNYFKTLAEVPQTTNAQLCKLSTDLKVVEPKMTIGHIERWPNFGLFQKCCRQFRAFFNPFHPDCKTVFFSLFTTFMFIFQLSMITT